jgi:hypothetical protein
MTGRPAEIFFARAVVVGSSKERHRLKTNHDLGEWLSWRKKAHERAVALTAKAPSLTPVVMQFPSAQPAFSGSLWSPLMIKGELNEDDINESRPLLAEYMP